jgi:energy-coupling factor transport system ATP-binding protein
VGTHAPERAPVPEGDPVLLALGVTFAYDGPAVLRGIDLAIRPGERIALVGPNGSGKSTLARILVGLARPAAGTVRLGGVDPARLAARDLGRLAGFVVQDPEQQFVATRVRDEVLAGLDATDPATIAAVEVLMNRLGLPLEAFGDRSPYTLSGGEQRRLSLAPALARSPRLMVLDEPTFGQDRRGYEALLAILRERVGSGTAVLAATHDERFVDDFATRVIRIEAGRIVADEAVGARPLARDVAR